jgi:hypothetical protein
MRCRLMLEIRAYICLFGVLSKPTIVMSVVVKHVFTMDIRDKIISIFVLLQSTKSHLCSRNILLRVLEVFKLQPVSLGKFSPLLLDGLTRVSSFQVMPFCLLASV